MENGSQLSISLLREVFREAFFPQEKRRVVCHTGAGGYELFGETIDNQNGYYRIYIGHKVPRILRRLKGYIYKSPTGRYYKKFKSEQ